VRSGADAEFVVAASDVPGERVPGGDHLGGAEPFQPSHRPQPRLQPAVIGSDEVVRSWGVDVVGGGEVLVEDPRVGRGAVGEARTSMTWPNWSTAR
jgi:hypothetical protein